MANKKTIIISVIAVLIMFAMAFFAIKYSESKNTNVTDENTTAKLPETTNIDTGTLNIDSLTTVFESVTEQISPETTAAPETTEEPVTTDVPETTPTPPDYVAVSSIKLSLYELILYPAYSQMPIVTMYPENATNKGEIWVSSDTSVAIVDMYGNITGVAPGNCTVTVTSASEPTVKATVNVTVVTDVEPTYIDGILVVNKTYALPKSYAPGWDAEASSQLLLMFADAKAQGYNLWVNSGYRSYIDQYIIYYGYVSQDGQENADRYSARPGHSEHQSGLAFDLNDLPRSFGDTPEGKWVADNCHKYGFIVRYPKDKEAITGYIYEPWHVRYLGVEKATAVYESGLCLEEYLGITSDYSHSQK